MPEYPFGVEYLYTTQYELSESEKDLIQQRVKEAIDKAVISVHDEIEYHRTWDDTSWSAHD